MDATTFFLEATGHLLQIAPAMLLYFLCIPEERFRYDRKKTIAVFSIALLIETILRVIAKLTIPRIHTAWGAHETGSVLLLLVIALLILTAPCAVDVPRFRNIMVLLIVFFGGCAQIMIVNLFCPDTGVFYVSLVATYAVVTAILFPAMKVLFVSYVQEYIRLKDVQHIRSVFAIVSTLTLVVLIQVMSVSWLRMIEMAPVTVVVIVSMMLTYWMFLRYVVTGEREDRIRRHLLAAQIQPHFIYNAMNTIHGLCDEDVEEAKQAICDFSDYLRANFESLEKTEPVFFEEELEHTRFYLSLEKLRFGDELQMVFDLQAKDFKLPPLTVQPLVENAVRHGLRKKPGVGTLTLKTCETAHAFEVIIEDDGVGFDPQTLATDDHIHVGIANARTRLERMSNGTLIVESAPNEGTKITIRIAKEAKP